MRTLYDLLGALPDDDAESLRAAFRRSAKGAHPDLNPADPDAALRFRQLVRANEILSDEDQRAAYDYLLHLAHLEQEAARKPTVAAVHRIAIGAACGVIALAGMLVVSEGYKLFLHVNVNGTLLAPATAVTTELSTALARTHRHNKPEAVGTPRKLDEYPNYLKRATAPSVLAIVQGTARATAATNVPLVRAFATHYRERGILAYHSGDLYLALVDFNLAIQFDPSFSDAYIDRAIVFYRMGNQESALADVAQAKRIHHESSKTHPPQAHLTPSY